METEYKKTHESIRRQSNIIEFIKGAVESKKRTKQIQTKKNKTEKTGDAYYKIESEENNQNDFILNDSIMVRYFQRKTCIC